MSVDGDHAVSGVRFYSGHTIECDTVVVAAGIRPNIELARAAWLSVGRGVRVNDHLQTSDPDIYAVGECVEHRGRVYGLVAPGLEQAAVAAHRIHGGRSRYRGSSAAARLKVVGCPVFSVGQIDTDTPVTGQSVLTYERRIDGVYRKLVLHKNRLVGALGIGEWPEASRVQEAVGRRRRVYAWQRRRFYHCGRLWRQPDAQRVAQWPAGATVCNCTGVTRGTLSGAVRAGCATVEALAAQTGASTVCGSCQPLLADLLGRPAPAAPATPAKAAPALLGVSLAAAVLALLVSLMPPVPVSPTVQQVWHPEVLWTDGTWKQVSGYSLLTLSLVALLLSLRKRWPRFNLGAFARWRTVHAVLGASVLLVLFAHTGLRLGANLNFALMTVFLGLALAGAAAGAVTALEARVGGVLARRLRSWSNWVHLLLFWPLPVLLGFHIVSVYYF